MNREECKSKGHVLCSLKKRIELEKALRVDGKYQKAHLKAHKTIMQIDKIKFNSEQWKMIDHALCVTNERCSEYGRVSYYQGFQDALNYLVEACLYQ